MCVTVCACVRTYVHHSTPTPPLSVAKIPPLIQHSQGPQSRRINNIHGPHWQWKDHSHERAVSGPQLARGEGGSCNQGGREGGREGVGGHNGRMVSGMLDLPAIKSSSSSTNRQYLLCRRLSLQQARSAIKCGIKSS